jgi:heptosyltransferase-2
MQLLSPTSQQRKVLVLRLSSLGDIILASSVLSEGVFAGPVDWVVAKEFAPLLRGHPRIGRLWEFDRADGIAGWLKLCQELRTQGYDSVIDLHGSLRTRLARLLFIASGSLVAIKSWRTFSKERWRLYGLYIFKRYWPDALRPGLFVARFTRFAGGSGTERPDLTHLTSGAVLPDLTSFTPPKAYYCVMPSSKWRGKCWPAPRFLEVIREVQDAVPVVLGGGSDEGSRELVELLEKERVPFESGVGRWDLKQVAQILAGSCAYLGNDTGLAHLAEAVGVPAIVIYGPTTPSMGFGPWRKQSAAIGMSNLACRPCGKDGRRCYRLVRKYLCLEGILERDVVRALKGLIGGSGKGM